MNRPCRAMLGSLVLLLLGCATQPDEPTPVPRPAPLPEDSPVVDDHGTPPEAPADPAARTLAAAEQLVGRGDPPSLRKAGELLVESDLLDRPEARALGLLALETYLRDPSAEDLALLAPLLEQVHAAGFGAPETYVALSRAHAAAGSPDEAAAALEGALALDPSHGPSLLLRAELQLSQGRAKEAASSLDTLLGYHPLHQKGLLLRARLYYDHQGDTEKALVVAEKGEEAFPGDPRFPELRGEVLLQLGRVEEAREALQRVLLIEPERRLASLLLARTFMAEGRWTEAEEVLDTFRSFDNEAELLTARAVYAHLQRTDRLLAVGRRLYELRPTYAALYTADLIEAGRLETAAAVIDEALARVEPGSVKSRLYVHRSRLAADPYGPVALRDLRSALAEDPENTDALVALARHLDHAGDAAKAHRYASLALQRLPNDEELRGYVEELGARLEAEGQ